MKRWKLFLLITLAVGLLLGLSCSNVLAAPTATPAPGISINVNSGSNTADSLQILFMLTILSLAPSILIMMTGFTRIIIVLSFLRNALGLQQTPPNQVLIGIALFLTLFIMMPIFNQINTEAYVPYTKKQITQEVAVKKAMVPIRQFMIKQTGPKEMNLFISLAKMDKPKTYDEIPNTVLIPAFVTSELKRAFIIGFMIFIPFLIIDMVVASTLMSMGMIMLPPVMISLPFKILLFILVDGWGLLIKTLVTSFH